MSYKQMKLSPGGPIKTLLKSWAETAGRTIKSVTEEPVPWHGCQFLVLRFTDDSGLLLKCIGGEHMDGYSSDPDNLGDSSWLDDRAARAYFGIDSLEAFNRAEEESAAKDKAATEARELAQFAALKRKFEKLQS